MKFTTRGFTLVELMIVIAIIGILATALFPALTGYLAGSRDSARITNVRAIKLGATGYFTSNNNYNAIIGTGNCVNANAIEQFMGNKVPRDDDDYIHAGCVGDYATAKVKLNNTQAIAFFAQLETEGKGNTGFIAAMSPFTGVNMINVQELKTGGSNSGYLDVQ